MGKQPGSDIDTFTITPYGLTCLAIRQTSSAFSLLEKYFQPDNVDKGSKSVTEFDMVLSLAKKGWDYKSAKPSRNLPPYEPSGEKVWFYHSLTAKGGINKKYLETLLSADDLFKRGLTKIYHFQLVKYCRALLTVPDADLDQVLPFQTKNYYDLLLQTIKKKNTTAARTRTAHPNFGEAEDEPGALCPMLI